MRYTTVGKRWNEKTQNKMFFLVNKVYYSRWGVLGENIIYIYSNNGRNIQKINFKFNSNGRNIQKIFFKFKNKIFKIFKINQNK